MKNKTTDIIIYMIYAMISAVIYGFFAFFIIYRHFSGGDMLYSYLWNIAFMVILLFEDKYTYKRMLAKDFNVTRKNYIYTKIMVALGYTSFRTTMYLFYIFILIVSRVSILRPEFIPEEFRNFVLSIEYSLILLVVFDKFFEYILKDNVRIQKISGKITSFLKRDGK